MLETPEGSRSERATERRHTPWMDALFTSSTATRPPAHAMRARTRATCAPSSTTADRAPAASDSPWAPAQATPSVALRHTRAPAHRRRLCDEARARHARPRSRAHAPRVCANPPLPTARRSRPPCARARRHRMHLARAVLVHHRHRPDQTLRKRGWVACVWGVCPRVLYGMSVRASRMAGPKAGALTLRIVVRKRMLMAQNPMQPLHG